MAIAFDASNGSLRTSLGDLTFSHTTSGTDRILLVSAWAGQPATSPTLTGVTYNGSSLTELTGITLSGGSSLILIRKVYYMVAPSTGTNNVIVSRGGTGIYTWAHSATYTGVNQSSPIDTSGTNTTTGTSLTASVTTTADNCWLTGFFTTDTNSTITAGTNTTKRNDQASWSANFDSNAAQTPAGSHSQQMTTADSRYLTMQVVAIAPVAAASTFTPKVMFF